MGSFEQAGTYGIEQQEADDQKHFEACKERIDQGDLAGALHEVSVLSPDKAQAEKGSIVDTLTDKAIELAGGNSSEASGRDALRAVFEMAYVDRMG